jgi:hypothetical protein
VVVDDPDPEGTGKVDAALARLLGEEGEAPIGGRFSCARAEFPASEPSRHRTRSAFMSDRSYRMLPRCASSSWPRSSFGGVSLAAAEDAPAEGTVKSPWLGLPIVSSSPKLGTSGGLLGAYLHRFDPDSRVSMFGLAAQYSSTGSLVGGAFARISFGADHHRVLTFGGGGRVKNDYDDFLGTGVPLKTEDDLWAVVGRYLYRFHGSWFAGAQGSFTNYAILGEAALDQQVLTVLGLTGFQAGGLGGVLYRDSRTTRTCRCAGGC